MRRRRPPVTETPNRERWLISYADFITLLFGFFVVMYSVSSVNEGKYKVLSETLEGIFNAPRRTIEPIPVGDQSPQARMEPAEEVIQPIAKAPKNQEGLEERHTRQLKEVADQFAGEFSALIEQGVVSVDRTDDWIELTLRNSLLFGAGTAVPHYDAFPLVERVADILEGLDNAIVVEGFTDNRPISTARYPSNWELSAARAAAVVRLLTENGINPRRLAAVGYGAYQPLARNDTPEGRRRNRRVVILVSRDTQVRGAVR